MILRTSEGSLDQQIATLERDTGLAVSVTIASDQGPAELYLDLAEFLLLTGLSLDRILVAHDPEQPAVGEVLEDLFWGHSTRFLEGLPPSPERTIEDRLFVFAHFLSEHDQPFHAVKLLYRLRATLEPGRLAPLVARCWAALSCYEPLLEWISQLVRGRADQQQFTAEIEASIARSRRFGEESWSRNLAALEARFPILIAELRQLRPSNPPLIAVLSKVPWVFQSQQSPTLLPQDYLLQFEIDADGQIRERNPCSNPQPLHRLIRNLTDELKMIHAVLVGSLKPYSALFNVYINPTVFSPYPEMQQALYVVERDLEYLYHLLHTVDLSSIWQQPYVFLFAGPKAVDELGEFLQRNSGHATPMLNVNTDEETLAVAPRVAAWRSQHVERLEVELAQCWAADFDDELRAVLQERSRPLRVWMHCTQFTNYAPRHMRDLACAWRELGAEVELYHEANNWERLSKELLIGSLIATRPDVVFLYNSLRSTVRFPIPPQVPVAAWFQDDSPEFRNRDNISRLGPKDFTFCSSVSFVRVCQELGYPHTRLLPMGVNEAVYRPSSVPGHPRDEVTFLSEMMPLEDPEGFRGLRDWLLAIFEKRGCTYQNYSLLTSYVREGLSALGYPPKDDAITRIVRWSTWAERMVYTLEVVRWLKDADVPLALYGRGWSEWPEFAPLARGEVRQGEELAQCYRETKILMHINTAVNLHQRVFEGIASGAFLAVRSLPSDGQPGGLAAHFRIGEEIAVFSTREELLALVERARSDEPWRHRVIESGQRRVAADHTYTARMRTVQEELRAGLLDRRR